MELKRYSTKELIDICSNIFYDYMSNSPIYYSKGEIFDCDNEYPTPIDYLYSENMNVITEAKERINLYTELLYCNHSDLSSEDRISIKKQVDLLNKEISILSNSCMAEQKKRYKETKKIDFTQSNIRIPLDKKINSYYDNLYLTVLFYDDICVAKGKYKEYKTLKSEKRLDFIKQNTKITRMCFNIFSNDLKLKAIIGLKGNLNKSNKFYKDNFIPLLDKSFSDFNSLTLEQTMLIKNNDLRQFFQEKIDMDKQNLKYLCSTNIRGNDYSIYKYNIPKEILEKNYILDMAPQYYIRYVCSSTGRVYYNRLALKLLEQVSHYFKRNDYTSYMKAWWSVTHLGANIDGNEVIDC